MIDYATHHKDDAPLSPEDENKNITKSSEDIDEWDKEFINVDQGTLFEIILAANYLDMKGLLDLGRVLGLKLALMTWILAFIFTDRISFKMLNCQAARLLLT